MGASESRDHSHDCIKEETNTTPIQNRRLLKLQDPRSPSEHVSRTPIIADASDFQDPRSPTAEICRTPVVESEDPRSPTEGIPRTPANPFIFPDPRSPTAEMTRTPLIKTIGEDENIRRSETEEQPADLRRRKVRETDGEEGVNNNTNNDGDNRLKKNNEDEEGKCEQAKDKDVDATEDSVRQLNAPQFELEMARLHLDEAGAAKEVQEDSQCATLVLSNTESRVKSRGNPAAKRSLKENLRAASLAQRSRSPLSSRNVLQNSPSVSTTGTKHNAGAGRHPTRLTGRYGAAAALDKENI